MLLKTKINHYPFGSPMSSRSFNANSSRYGFNGKEKDDETNVNGGSYDFGARIYDSRLGRWLAVDSKASEYADISPYVFSGNNPIVFIDPDGNRIVDGQGRRVKVRWNENGELVFKGRGKLTEDEKANLRLTNNFKVGREWIENMEKNHKKIYPKVSNSLALYPAGNAKSENKQYVMDGMSDGLYKNNEVNNTNYFRLYGLTYDKELDNGKVVTVSEIYIFSIMYDQDPETAIDFATAGKGSVVIVNRLSDGTEPKKAGNVVLNKLKSGVSKILPSPGSKRDTPPFKEDYTGQVSTRVHETVHATDKDNGGGEVEPKKQENKVRNEIEKF